MKTKQLILCCSLLIAVSFLTTEMPADQDVAKTDVQENNKVDAKSAADAESDAEAKLESDAKSETGAESESDASAEGDDLDERLAGHSFHGETFNEGPRSAAVLIGETGDVHFPATTENEQAQKFIDQGVGQLHGFWYLEAERSFRQAIALDPDCAIAYWGAALANQNNSKRARGFIDEAVKRKGNASKREQAYIDALDRNLKPIEEKDKTRKKEQEEKRAIQYCRDLEDIIFENPDDIEARALLVLQAYHNERIGIPVVSYYAIDALIQDIFDVQPDHPVHHYCIHLWDKRKPEMALKSAAACGQAAPSVAHMWHMPGHIYSRLNRYEDAAWQQEASARVDHAHMMRERLMPDQIFNFSHNNEWLIRNMIFTGRVDDAIELARNMCSLPRHPDNNTLKKGSSYYGNQRLMEVCFQYGRWDALIQAAADHLLDADEAEQAGEDHRIQRHRALAVAYLMTDQAERSTEHLDALDEMTVGKRQDMNEAIEKALKEIKEKNSKAKPEDLEKKQAAARQRVEKDYSGKIKTLQKTIRAVEGYQALHEEDFKTAAAKFKDADVDESLKLESQLLAAKAGEDEDAQQKALELIDAEVAKHKNEVVPAARRVFMLNAAGKREQAKQALESLRTMSGSIDMSSPLISRLSVIAEELGFESDWRLKREIPADVGNRPPLESLGPLNWRPSHAPDWELPDEDNEIFVSKQLEGQPTVLIFYLGHGCLHCIEQLDAFAPEMNRFEEAGIRMLAISSEEVLTLKDSLIDFDKPMQIPLLADGKLEVFKAFGAYDDFEQQPLHGTFLIDSQGRIRWQDINYEPFMDHQFLLEESRRLLSLGE